MMPTKKARAAYRLARRTRLTRASPFTPELLRGTLEEALGLKYAIPTPEQLVGLCASLNRHHAWFFQAQEVRRLNDMRRRGRAAFDTLREILPEIVDALAPAVASNDPFAQPQMRAAQRAVAFLQSTNSADFLQAENLPDVVCDWRWLAKALPPDIEAALRQANPDLRLGHTKGGPLARVLSALIPRVSGETPTAAAVGSQLILLARTAGSSAARRRD